MASLGILFLLALPLAVVWYQVRAWVAKGESKKPFKRKRNWALIVLIAIFCITAYFAVQQAEEKALQAGFKTYEDYRDARKQGISDPKVWETWQSEQQSLSGNQD